MTSFPPPPPSCARFAELDTEGPPFCGPASQWRADSLAESGSCRRPLADATQVSPPPTGGGMLSIRLGPAFLRGGEAAGLGCAGLGGGSRAPATELQRLRRALQSPRSARPSGPGHGVLRYHRQPARGHRQRKPAARPSSLGGRRAAPGRAAAATAADEVPELGGALAVAQRGPAPSLPRLSGLQ